MTQLETVTPAKVPFQITDPERIPVRRYFDEEFCIAFGELFKRFPDFEVDSSRATRSVLSNVRGVRTLPARLGTPA